MWFVCRCHFVGTDLPTRRVSLSLSLSPILMTSFSRVKTKIQQRALSGTPPRGVWETLRRLVRGTLDLFIMFHVLLIFNTRFRPERPQTSACWDSTDLSRSRCERGAKHHHTWTLVDFFRYHVALYRSLTVIPRPFETSICITT